MRFGAPATPFLGFHLGELPSRCYGRGATKRKKVRREQHNAYGKSQAIVRVRARARQAESGLINETGERDDARVKWHK